MLKRGWTKTDADEGFVYAITQMGPNCDLIKIGQTMHPPTHGLWRPETAIAQEHNSYLRVIREYRQRLLTLDAPRVWIAEAYCRRDMERVAHDLVSQHRVRNPVGRLAWRPDGRVAGSLELFRIDLPTALDVLFRATGSLPMEVIR